MSSLLIGDEGMLIIFVFFTVNKILINCFLFASDLDLDIITLDWLLGSKNHSGFHLVSGKIVRFVQLYIHKAFG